MPLNKNFQRNTPTQMLMNFNCSAEQLYYDDLPYHPYCTDNFQTEGSYQLRRDKAIEKSIIQHNPNYLVRCLVFDMDKPKNATKYWHAEQHWKDVDAPEPNWIIINPVNGHAHYYYMLTTPVPITDNSRIKPRKYVAAIQRALRIKLQADRGYADHLAKNPTHIKWNTILTRYETYPLEELAQYVNLETLIKTPKRESEGLGRHCILFDELRWWAYSRVNSAKNTMNFEQWFNSLSAKADALNTFNNRLSYSSINSTVKSVARWTWTKYDGKGDSKRRGRDTAKNHQLELADKQAYSAIKTNEQRKQTSERKIEAAIRLLQKENKRVSIRSVAQKSKLSKGTIENHKSVLLRCTSDNPSF
jgi:hypothetical protein